MNLIQNCCQIAKLYIPEITLQMKSKLVQAISSLQANQGCHSLIFLTPLNLTLHCYIYNIYIFKVLSCGELPCIKSMLTSWMNETAEADKERCIFAHDVNIVHTAIICPHDRMNHSSCNLHINTIVHSLKYNYKNKNLPVQWMKRWKEKKVFRTSRAPTKEKMIFISIYQYKYIRK